MTYAIEIYSEARDQIRAMPPGLVKELAEVMVTLELTPWCSKPINEDNPSGSVRQVVFGYNGAALHTFLILERQRCVNVLDVTWLG